MFGDLHILLLAEDPFQLKLLARQLSNQGVGRIDACISSDEALARLDDGLGIPGIAFLDIGMEGIDCGEFVHHLVERGFRGELVLVSGDHERVLSIASEASEYGLDVLGHLRKPVRPDTLRALLERAHVGIPGTSEGVRSKFAPDEVRRAIDQGELLNHYQPKVEVATGAVTGVEALVRWQHPTHGRVSPDQFISVAEEHDMIDELTLAVLERALLDAAGWRTADIGPQIAVNVSIVSLTHGAISERVWDALVRAGIPATELILEFAEPGQLKVPSPVHDAIVQFRRRQIGLSMDDFGAGHASLEWLHTLRFGEIKIDRGLLSGARGDPVLATRFRSSIELVRRMGITVVAEGIEDAADWAFLRGTGCDQAQGWFIARPMPAADLPAWRTTWERRRAEISG